MAVKASVMITITKDRDTNSITRYYLLQASTASKPVKPTTLTPPKISTAVSGWDDTEPTYTSGSTNTLYFVDRYIFTDGTFQYTEVSKSSSYEAAKEAYNKAQAAQNTADTTQENLDNLQIGGRNLLPKTQEFLSVSGMSASSILSNDVFNSLKIRKCNSLEQTTGTTSFIQYSDLRNKFNIDFKQSDVFTFSFWIKAQKGENASSEYGNQVYAYFYGNTNYSKAKVLDSASGYKSSWYQDGGCPINYNHYLEDEKWHRFYVVWEIDPDATEESLSVQKHILIRQWFGWNIEICGIKLEYGNKPTDWSSAPEDVLDILEVGGRNYIKNSVFATTNNISPTYSTTDGWGIHSANTTIGDDSNIMHNNHNYLHRYRINQTENSWSELQYWFNNIDIFKNKKIILSFLAYITDLEWLNNTDNSFSLNIRYRKTGSGTVKDVGSPFNFKNELKNALNNWYKIVWSFDFPTDIDELEADSFFIMITGNKNFDVYLTEFKLEIGNKVTDWSPAPEDTDQDINDRATELSGKINQNKGELEEKIGEAKGIAESKLDADQVAEAISTAITTNNAELKIDSLRGAIQALTTQVDGKYQILEQNGEGWSFSFGSLITDVIKTIDKADDALDKLNGTTDSNLKQRLSSWERANSYIRIEDRPTGETDPTGAPITKPVIVLATNQDNFKVEISNSSIDFYEGTNKVAYVSNQAFYNTTGIVREEIRIMSDESGGFAWKTRQNGNLGLTWLAQISG